MLAIDVRGHEVTEVGTATSSMDHEVGQEVDPKAGQNGQRYLLRTENLSKSFSGLYACQSIDLAIEKGEIHALLGENGAGKSTFVKMLFGSLEPSAGRIFWQGEQEIIHSPSYARSLGIGMVFQHFSLFESLSVAENIALSLPEGQAIDHIGKTARDLSITYGLPLDPDMLVADLSVGERQRIEIIRCLMQDPKLIILDEPTSVLTPQEAQILFKTLNRLKDEGRSVLYISHRLEEVKQICDKATVLRGGVVVSHCTPSEETAGSLARMMVGTEIKEVKRTHISQGEFDSRPLVEMQDYSTETDNPFGVTLKNIDLHIAAGEILGVAGIGGNGQSELFEALSGENMQSISGVIRFRGQQVNSKDIGFRRRLGAAFVPEERMGHAAVPLMPLSKNLLLSRHHTDGSVFLGPLGYINSGALKSAMERISSKMDVRKPDGDAVASALSGGNLQKFIIGRELDRSPSILIVNQPSWGVDAGAAANIRQSIIDLAAMGSAVLVISQDLDELFEICHSIAVIHDGTLSEPLDAAITSREAVGVLMGGSGSIPNYIPTFDDEVAS